MDLQKKISWFHETFSDFLNNKHKTRQSNNKEGISKKRYPHKYPIKMATSRYNNGNNDLNISMFCVQAHDYRPIISAPRRTLSGVGWTEHVCTQTQRVWTRTLQFSLFFVCPSQDCLSRLLRSPLISSLFFHFSIISISLLLCCVTSFFLGVF